jgi:MinD-like ATPase involved in chromosome partitioning or flagellar assembly
MKSNATDESAVVTAAAGNVANKRVILSMGGKGGVGKTSFMTALAEWFDANEIPVNLLDLDTENKARGSLGHFFGERAPKVDIHTPAGLDAFVGQLADGEPVILADMGAGAGRVAYDWFEQMYPDAWMTVFDRLRPEQRKVVGFVLASRDLTVNICGAAGTGKTATLEVVRKRLIEAGRDLQAIGPTMSAVAELQKVGFYDAITVERLIQDPNMRAAVYGKVLIVDEAGMISGRQMWELLKLAQRRDTRIVFSGDTKQISSVEAGDALRILEQESRLKSVAQVEVQRQKVTDYRDAIEELRRNPERGFEKLDAIGGVREVPLSGRAAVWKPRANWRGGRAQFITSLPQRVRRRETPQIRRERTHERDFGR